MKITKNLIFVFILLSTKAYNQISVQIHLKDNLTSEILPFSTLLLISKGKSNKTGAISDSTGKFNLIMDLEDSVTIIGSYLGYYEKSHQIFIAKDTVIIMRLDPKLNPLGELVVNANFLERKADRVVLTINNKKEKGKFVGESIRVMPHVSISTEGLKIKGESNYKVFKDGMPSNLSMKDLNNMPTNLFSSIEIIYYPSSKYDGEVEQIINLISKKNQYFRGGSYWIGLGNRTGLGLNNNSVGYNYSKINDSKSSEFSIDYTYDQTKIGASQRFAFDTSLLEQSSNGLKGVSDLTIKQSNNYNFRKNNSLAIGILGNFQNTKSFIDFEPVNDYLSTQNRDNEKNISFTTNYSKKFNNGNILYASNLIDGQFTSSIMDISKLFGIIQNINNSNNFTRKTQADFEINSNKYFLSEIGVFNISRKMRQNTELNKIYKELNFNQQIIGFFMNKKFNFEKLYINVGIRGESTNNRIKKDTSFSQFNLLPKFLMSYSLTKNNKVNFSYSRRIQRPDFLLLSNFLDISNPFFSLTGNEYLNNEIYNTIETEFSSQIKKGFLNLGISGITGLNLISSYRNLNNNNLIEAKYANISKSRSYGLRFSYNTPLWVNKLYFFTSGYLGHRFIYSDNFSNKGVIKSLNLGTSVTLSKKLTVDFFSNIIQNNIGLQVSSSNTYYMDVLCRYLFNSKSSIVLRSLNPVFGKIITKSASFGQQFSSSMESYYLGRTFQLTYSYSFGKSKEIENKTKEIQINDLKVSE